MSKSFYKLLDINTDIILMNDDVDNIENAIKEIKDYGHDIVVERDGNTFKTLKGVYVMLSLGEKITVFENDKFVYGWL